MIPTIAKERPPFVRFEEREYGRNVEASKAAGRPIPNVVVMACITPHGSKDCFEQPAEEWLAKIRDKAERGEYPPEWSERFQAAYDAWKRGHELPPDGTPMKTWQLGTGEQRARLIALGYRTVEDLAQVPDSALGHIGLDGRVLRDQARAWIDEAKDKGINAQKIADLEVQNLELRSQNEALADRLAALEAKLAEGAEDEKPARARKSAA